MHAIYSLKATNGKVLYKGQPGHVAIPAGASLVGCLVREPSIVNGKKTFTGKEPVKTFWANKPRSISKGLRLTMECIERYMGDDRQVGTDWLDSDGFVCAPSGKYRAYNQHRELYAGNWHVDITEEQIRENVSDLDHLEVLTSGWLYRVYFYADGLGGSPRVFSIDLRGDNTLLKIEKIGWDSSKLSVCGSAFARAAALCEALGLDDDDCGYLREMLWG